MKSLLILGGLAGFVFTIYQEKPPGIYFFACSILMIAVLGSVLASEKRPGIFKILGAILAVTAIQQVIISLLASELSRVWLTLQYLGLQTSMVGAMLSPRRNQE